MEDEARSKLRGLAAKWDEYAHALDHEANVNRAAGRIEDAQPLETKADAYEECASDLRRWLATV